MKTNAIDFYDKMGKQYDSEYNSHYWILERMVSMQIIQRYVKDTYTVVDLGAGTGIYTSMLKNQVEKIIGIEPSPNMIRIFKEKNPHVEAYMATAEHIPLDSDEIDMVIAMGDVLSYVSDLGQSLREIQRILKPGGILIASVDNYHFFAKDVYKYGTLSDIKKFISHQTVEIGTSDMHFTSRTFRWDELEQLASQYKFYHLQTVFKLVGHKEDENISNLSKALDVELQLNQQIEFAGCAEHLMFVWIKRG